MRQIPSGGLFDVVVIDESIVWVGDISPLGYPRKGDCSLRFVNREVAADLLAVLGR